MAKSKKRTVKHNDDRQAEAARNRKTYASWKDVYREPQLVKCGGCEKRIMLKGNGMGESCKNCGTPITLAR